MDWFRWHHGSATDPKFQLIAKRSGASVAEVLALWVCLLEAASQSLDRGNTGDLDFEAMDCALGLNEGLSAKIYDEMGVRGLIEENSFRISSWDKRQPKREREDDSAERVRNHRKRHVTPRNANGSQETPRGDKSREEEIKEKTTPPNPPRGDDGPVEFQAFWAAYPKKVSKPDALKAWRKLNPDTQTSEAITDAVTCARRSEQWLKNSGEFIPNPATFLNKRKWEDVVESIGYRGGNDYRVAGGFVS